MDLSLSHQTTAWMQFPILFHFVFTHGFANSANAPVSEDFNDIVRFHTKTGHLVSF